MRAGGKNKQDPINKHCIIYTIVGDTRKKVCPFYQGCRVSTWQTSRKRGTGCRLWTTQRPSETMTHSSSSAVGDCRPKHRTEDVSTTCVLSSRHMDNSSIKLTRCVLLGVSHMPPAILSVFSYSWSSEKERVRLRVRLVQLCDNKIPFGNSYFAV